MGTILLIDDDCQCLAPLKQYLELAGYSVIVAESGAEAMAILEQTPMDLVITDVLMPKQDGLEIIREVRKRWPTVKVMAMSGGGSCSAGTYLDLSLKLGACHAVEKPFSLRQLLVTIRAALAQVAPAKVSERYTRATGVGRVMEVIRARLTA